MRRLARPAEPARAKGAVGRGRHARAGAAGVDVERAVGKAGAADVDEALRGDGAARGGVRGEGLERDGLGAVDARGREDALADGPEAELRGVGAAAGREAEELDRAGDVGREGDGAEDPLVVVAGIERDEEELEDAARGQARREGVHADGARLAVGDDGAGDEPAVGVGEALAIGVEGLVRGGDEAVEGCLLLLLQRLGRRIGRGKQPGLVGGERLDGRPRGGFPGGGRRKRGEGLLDGGGPLRLGRGGVRRRRGFVAEPDGRRAPRGGVGGLQRADRGEVRLGVGDRVGESGRGGVVGGGGGGFGGGGGRFDDLGGFGRGGAAVVAAGGAEQGRAQRREGEGGHVLHGPGVYPTRRVLASVPPQFPQFRGGLPREGELW